MIKWTYEACYEEAKKYSSRSEFKANNGSAYSSARINKWLDDYTWFIGYRWTYDKCLEESKKYSTRGEFAQKKSRAYHIASKNGWIEDFIWLLDGRSLKLEKWGKWTKETCFEEAKKYKSKSEFYKSNNSAYNSARKHDWLKNYTHLLYNFLQFQIILVVLLILFYL